MPTSQIQITRDDIYDTVAPADLAALMHVDRYGRRTTTGRLNVGIDGSVGKRRSGGDLCPSPATSLAASRGSANATPSRPAGPTRISRWRPRSANRKTQRLRPSSETER
jgi:hypothetical protein